MGNYWPHSARKVPADGRLASPGWSLPFRCFGVCVPLEAPLLTQQPGAALAVPARGASLLAGRGSWWAEAAALLLRCSE